MANLLSRATQIAKEKGIPCLIRSACRYTYRRILDVLEALEVPLAIYAIRKFRSTEVEDILNFVYTFKVFKLNIRPMQVREEIKELLNILYIMKPKNILEIGTASGGTLFLFCRIASPDATIISVDLHGYSRWKIPLYKSFVKEGQKLYLIRADSHAPSTLEVVKAILGDRNLDFLFIDGDHTYEGVRKDFEMYGPLVREGGIIAFHDIVPLDKAYDPDKVGVPLFWTEIKESYEYLEIVKDYSQGWNGIGVLYVSHICD